MRSEFHINNELESILKKIEKIDVLQRDYGDIVFKVEKGSIHQGETLSANETKLHNLNKGNKVDFKEGHQYAVLPKTDDLSFFQLQNKQDRSNSFTRS